MGIRLPQRCWLSGTGEGEFLPPSLERIGPTNRTATEFFSCFVIVTVESSGVMTWLRQFDAYRIVMCAARWTNWQIDWPMKISTTRPNIPLQAKVD